MGQIRRRDVPVLITVCLLVFGCGLYFLASPSYQLSGAEISLKRQMYIRASKKVAISGTGKVNHDVLGPGSYGGLDVFRGHIP